MHAAEMCCRQLFVALLSWCKRKGSRCCAMGLAASSIANLIHTM